MTFFSIRIYMPKFKAPKAMSLRTRGHNFFLPIVRYKFYKKNFIVRALYELHLIYRCF